MLCISKTIVFTITQHKSRQINHLLFCADGAVCEGDPMTCACAVTHNKTGEECVLNGKDWACYCIITTNKEI